MAGTEPEVLWEAAHCSLLQRQRKKIPGTSNIEIRLCSKGFRFQTRWPGLLRDLQRDSWGLGSDVYGISYNSFQTDFLGQMGGSLPTLPIPGSQEDGCRSVLSTKHLNPETLSRAHPSNIQQRVPVERSMTHRGTCGILNLLTHLEGCLWAKWPDKCLSSSPAAS